MQQTLNRVTFLTFYQNEDPVWFLLGAFMFTSRTAHDLLEAFASNNDSNVEGLSEVLRGCRVSLSTDPLLSDAYASLSFL